MKLAYLVGIEDYACLDPAMYARADAQQLGITLERSCAFSDVTIAPAAATGCEITKWLESRSGALGRGDTFVFYFAGHGVYYERNAHLLGYDVERDLKKLPQRSVPLTKIFQLAELIGAQSTMIVCDCCREDPSLARGWPRSNMKQGMQDAARRLVAARYDDEPLRRNLAVLFGCSAGQRTYADLNRGQGAFTDALLQGIRGAASDTDGSLSMHVLAGFVGRQMETWTEANPNKPMTPHFQIHGHIELLPAGTRPAPVAASPARKFFRFSTGRCVFTQTEWMEWLAEHPESASAEVRLSSGLNDWLRQFMTAHRAERRSEILRAPDRGLWKELSELAQSWKLEEHLVRRLMEIDNQVDRLLYPCVSPERYFAAQNDWKQAQRLDPYSSKVAIARSRLDELAWEVGDGDGRKAALVRARELIHGRRWQDAIGTLRTIDQAGALGAAETRGMEELEAEPVVVSVAGAEYVHMPSGVFTTHTGRVVALSAFLLSRKPVTAGAYMPMGMPPVSPLANPGWADPHKPMVLIDWKQAAAFCHLYGGDLPTDSQWEYARRFAGALASWPELREWCQDIKNRKPELTPALDPVTSGEPARPGELRVVRYGAHAQMGFDARTRSEDISFRVVLPAAPHI